MAKQEISEALARYRRGESTLDEYLEALVERSVSHLKGLMSAENLEIIREIARDALFWDPGLRESIRQLTGEYPAEERGN